MKESERDKSQQSHLIGIQCLNVLVCVGYSLTVEISKMQGKKKKTSN